jgi:phage-related protein
MVGGFAISALISAIGTLLISIASIRIAMIVLRGTFITTYASMLLPIAAAVAIGVALGFLLKYLYNWFGGWEGIWNSVKGIIGSVADTIKGALGGAIDWVTSKFSGFGNWVGSIFSGLGNKFSNFTSQMSGFKPPNFNFSPNFAGSTGGGKSVVLNNQSPVNVNMYGSKASPASVASAVSGSQNTNMNSFFNNMNNSFLR